MHIRRPLLPLAAAAVLLCGATVPVPALAATTATRSADAHVAAAFAVDPGQDGAVWYLKPRTALRDPVQQGDVSGGITFAPLRAGTYVLRVQEFDDLADGDRGRSLSGGQGARSPRTACAPARAGGTLLHRPRVTRGAARPVRMP